MGCDKKVVDGKIRCGAYGSEGFTVVWRVLETPAGEKPYPIPEVGEISAVETEMPVQDKRSWLYVCSYHRGSADSEPEWTMEFWAWRQGEDAIVTKHEREPQVQVNHGCLVSFSAGRILYEKLIIHEKSSDDFLVSFPDDPDKTKKRKVWVPRKTVLFRDRPGSVGGRSCKCPHALWDSQTDAEFGRPPSPSPHRQGSQP